jgi:hypothetical protein
MKAHNLLQQAIYVPELLQQAIYVPELDRYFKSAHVHDYVVIDFPDGASYSLDGGTDYIRRGWSTGFDPSRFVEMSLYTDSPFKDIVANLLWGTYGKDGKQPFRWKPLCECDTDHLKAILDTQTHIKTTLVETVVRHILMQRAKKEDKATWHP